MRLSWAAGLAAALALAGCASTASHPAAAHTARHSTAPPSCQQRVDAWRANAGQAANYNEMDAAMSSVRHLAVSALPQGLVRVGNLAQQAEQWPFPACADPQGDYGKGLSYLITAGDDASSGSMGGLLSALHALRRGEVLLSDVANNLGNYGVS